MLCFDFFLKYSPPKAPGISANNGSISGPVGGVVLTCGAGKSTGVGVTLTTFWIQSWLEALLALPLLSVQLAWLTTQVIPCGTPELAILPLRLNV